MRPVLRRHRALALGGRQEVVRAGCFEWPATSVGRRRFVSAVLGTVAFRWSIVRHGQRLGQVPTRAIEARNDVVRRVHVDRNLSGRKVGQLPESMDSYPGFPMGTRSTTAPRPVRARWVPGAKRATLGPPPFDWPAERGGYMGRFKCKLRNGCLNTEMFGDHAMPDGRRLRPRLQRTQSGTRGLELTPLEFASTER